MIPLLLNLLYGMALLLLLPVLAYRICFQGKYLATIQERLGMRFRFPKLTGCIWIHGVSVGEIKAAKTLISLLRKSCPEKKIVVSSTSSAGKKTAEELYGEECLIVSFPLDFSWAVRRYLNQFQPCLVILLEWEIWPNFLHQCHRKEIPVILLNGRLSERSFKRCSRYFQRFFVPFTRAIRVFAMQSELYAHRVASLGIGTDRIAVTGNMKFDSVPAQQSQDDSMAKEMGIVPDLQILIAGSTHDPEEKILLECYRQLSPALERLRLILVPRQPQRASQVARYVEECGLRPVMRSHIPAGFSLDAHSILIVDTMGELARLYNFASIAVIGKSFVPEGGQNFIEPAALGKAVVCGPSMENFPDIRTFLDQKGIVQLKKVEDLLPTLRHLLENHREREELGRKAQSLVLASQGSSQRNCELCLQTQDTRKDPSL